MIGLNVRYPLHDANLAALERAMGSAGPGTDWQHIVNHNKTNAAKFAPEL